MSQQKNLPLCLLENTFLNSYSNTYKWNVVKHPVRLVAPQTTNAQKLFGTDIIQTYNLISIGLICSNICVCTMF